MPEPTQSEVVSGAIIAQLELPTIARYVRNRLRYAQSELRDAVDSSAEGADDIDMDVRLAVRFGDTTGVEALAVFTGPVDYDTWHGTVCASGTLTTDDTEADIRELASELICDAIDAVADHFGGAA